MERETEIAVLHVLRIAGYANLLWLVVMLLGMKAGWQSWLLVGLPVAISIVGALLYYTLWERTFPHTPRAEGRRFARPYILGTALLAGTVMLLLVLGMLGRSSA